MKLTVMGRLQNKINSAMVILNSKKEIHHGDTEDTEKKKIRSTKFGTNSKS